MPLTTLARTRLGLEKLILGSRRRSNGIPPCSQNLCTKALMTADGVMPMALAVSMKACFSSAEIFVFNETCIALMTRGTPRLVSRENRVLQLEMFDKLVMPVPPQTTLDHFRAFGKAR